MNMEILRKYGIKTIKFIPWEGGYLNITDEGLIYLRKSPYPKEYIEYLDLIKEFLADNGFFTTDRFYRFEGKPYLRYGKDLYIATKWIMGKKLDPFSKKAVEAMEFLARFHNASRGFFVENPPLYNNIYGFQGKIRKREEELVYLKNLLTMKGKRNAVDEYVLAHIDIYLDLARESIEGQQRDYHLRAADEKKKGYIAHLDYNYSNIVIDKDGELNLLGLKGYCPELLAIDIGNILLITMEYNNWDMELAQRMLEAYDRIRRIDPLELKIILHLLKFPFGFTRVVTMHYFYGYPWDKRALLNVLKAVEASRPKKLRFLENFLINQTSYPYGSR